MPFVLIVVASPFTLEIGQLFCDRSAFGESVFSKMQRTVGKGIIGNCVGYASWAIERWKEVPKTATCGISAPNTRPSA